MLHLFFFSKLKRCRYRVFWPRSTFFNNPCLSSTTANPVPRTARPLFNFSKADLLDIHQHTAELLKDINLLLPLSSTDYLWKFLRVKSWKWSNQIFSSEKWDQNSFGYQERLSRSVKKKKICPYLQVLSNTQQPIKIEDYFKFL